MDGDGRRRPGRARRAVARGAHAAVPRHHPGLVDRLGARRRRGGPRPHRRRARGADRRPARRRWRRRARCWPTPATVERDEVVVADVAVDGPVQRLADGRVAFRARVPGLALAAGRRAGGRPSASSSTDRTMANGRLAVSWDLDGNLRSIIDVAHARELLPAGELGAVLELGRRPPRALRRVGPRGLGAQRSAAPDVGRRRDRASSPGRSSGWCRCNVRSGRRRRRSRTCCEPARRASTSRSTSTGTTRSTCCRWRSRSTSAPTRRRAACSSAPSPARRTRRARGTPPSSRCARTATSTSPSRSFGVAVLNDGRYGHHVFDGAVRVSLVRGARYPDPDADQGRHRVTVSRAPARRRPRRRRRRGRAPRPPAARRDRRLGGRRHRRRPSWSPAPASRSTP